MQKRKTQKSSVASRIIAVVMVVVLLLGITYGAFAIVKKEANPLKWFEKEKTAESTPIGTMMLEFDNADDAPMKIGYAPAKAKAASPAAAIDDPMEQTVAKGNSIDVTVTTNPVDASIQTVTWGVAWTSSSDSWAQGKNAMDYIQIEPSEEDTKHATITCLQPFGATITIICTSDDKDDGTVSATCKAQYAKRITGGILQIFSSQWIVDEQYPNSSNFADMFYFNARNDEISPNKVKYTAKGKKELAEGREYQSKFVFNFTSGTGTKEEFISLDDRKAIAYSSDTTKSENQGKNENNLKLILRIKADKKQAIATATGLQLPDYKYEMDGGNIDVSEAFAQFFGGQENVTNKRTAIYNCLQGYCNSNEAAFEFCLTFTGISGTEYEFNFPFAMDVSAIRTPVQGLPGLDDEYIF